MAAPLVLPATGVVQPLSVEQLPVTFIVLVTAYLVSGLGSQLCEYLLFMLSFLGISMSVAMHRQVAHTTTVHGFILYWKGEGAGTGGVLTIACAVVDLASRRDGVCPTGLRLSRQPQGANCNKRCVFTLAFWVSCVLMGGHGTGAERPVRKATCKSDYCSFSINP